MYTNRLLSFLIAMLLVGLAFEAFAQEKQYGQRPVNVSKPGQYARAGMCSMGHNHVSGTTEEYVKTSTGTDDDNDKAWLIRYGSVVTISCDVATTFCMTHSTSATVSTDGWIDDSDSEGNHASDEGVGGCFNVLAGTYRDQVPWKGDFKPKTGSAVSIRTKSCEGTTETMDNQIHGYPCDADGDCFYSGATCDAYNPAGVYLVSIAAAASNCFVCVER